MVKSICNVTDFTKSMLYNYIKVVRLKLDQHNQWLRACTRMYKSYKFYYDWLFRAITQKQDWSCPKSSLQCMPLLPLNLVTRGSHPITSQCCLPDFILFGKIRQ